VLPGDQAPGGEAWNKTAYHELGHWVHNDVLDGFQKGDIVQEVVGSQRYIDEASVYYGDDTYRLRREYVADLIAAMVTQKKDSAPEFHRWGLGAFNERETKDVAILRRIINQAIEKSPEISRAFSGEPDKDRRVIVLLPEGAGEMLVVTAEEAYRNDWPEGVEVVDPNAVPGDVREAVSDVIRSLREPLDPVPREVRKAISGFVSSLRDVL
jgi:hypothetical protein